MVTRTHADIRRTAWLARHDPEWGYAWRHFPDPVLEHPDSGECLQYMGSAWESARDGWVHVFRHRHVPGSQQRQYWRIAASAGWAPEDPGRTKKITLHERESM